MMGYGAGKIIKIKLPEGLVTEGLDDEEKIMAIENYIKSTIHFTQRYDPAVYYARAVLKAKLADAGGLARLYAAIFKKLNIPFNIVITSDRYQNIFDPAFIDITNLCGKYYSISHKAKKFISPTRAEYRYGAPPKELAYNYGLFIESADAGELRVIPLPDVTKK